MNPGAVPFPSFYLQDLGRPLPNLVVNRTQPEWSVLIFGDFGAAAKYAQIVKIARPDAIRIGSLNALRGILFELIEACPKIKWVMLTVTAQRPRKIRIKDLLKETTPGRAP